MAWGAMGGIMQGLGNIGAAGASFHMQRQMQQWLKRMSNTAHQREVEDLKKAGLNPILSAKHGGASSPGGSIGSASGAGIGAAAAAGTQAETARGMALEQAHLMGKQGKVADNTAKKLAEEARTAKADADFAALRTKFYTENEDMLRLKELGGAGAVPASAWLIKEWINKEFGPKENEPRVDVITPYREGKAPKGEKTKRRTIKRRESHVPLRSIGGY